MVELSARDPENLSLEEVEVRLARPDERADTLVRENRYLEFKRFAGRVAVRADVAAGWRLRAGKPVRSSAGRGAGAPRSSFAVCEPTTASCR